MADDYGGYEERGRGGYDRGDRDRDRGDRGDRGDWGGRRDRDDDRYGEPHGRGSRDYDRGDRDYYRRRDHDKYDDRRPPEGMGPMADVVQLVRVLLCAGAEVRRELA